MAGKQFPTLAHARPGSSRRLLAFAFAAASLLLLLPASYFFLLSPSSPRSTPASLASPSPTTSFLASLDRFLAAPHPSASSTAPSNLNAAIRAEEEARLYGEPGSAWPAATRPLRVYVYEMPSKFTYDLLRLFRDSYRETDNLTSNGSPVHRLIEQEALKWVTDQPAWQRSEGRDHIISVHHPWSFKSVRRFVKKAIWLLPDMDSTGNWYKPGQVYLEKDVILPYVPNIEFCDSKCVSETQSKRSILLFFRGRLKRNAGGKIRSKLVAELKGAEDIVIEEGSAGAEGKTAAQNGMRKSIFCLSPAGDTPSSARLFDAIISGCIPVIISDELELPFEGILDYREIALFVSSSDAVQPGWLVNYLRGIDAKRVREMRYNLVKYSRHFLYSSPAQPLGPEDLTWRMIAGKLVNIKLHVRRSQRVVRESRSICTCECRVGNTTMML
ncbi:probable arabinosyltransferase ARAD1 isoform X2 [Phragmites australis]|uniref:probable arabinosyltransferase ARAD1 isoform X2 n=1 Tax=Phragmites australis TaxID=29695 RepID=UPI002D793C4A|nr:probable arabinosyltransferase ARAD1 isoform X2 [Phragmites australis]